MRTRLTSTLAGLALAAGATASIAASPATVEAACGSNDGVYASRSGVTATGTVYWGTSWYSVTPRVTITDRRDGVAGRVYIQFMERNGSYWRDRKVYAVPDGTTVTLPTPWTAGYQIQKVDIGVARVGDSAYQINWDTNDRCGA